MEAGSASLSETEMPLYQLGIDSKYGRVFVEIPPGTLAKMLEENKIDEAAQRFGNEPLFILRGTDPATPVAIDAWVDEQPRNPDAPRGQKISEIAQQAGRRAAEIEGWQADHPDFVKVAD